MLNCQGVTKGDRDLKRASTPKPVIVTDKLHDTKSRGRTSTEGSGCNEDRVKGKDDSHNLDTWYLVLSGVLLSIVYVNNSSTSAPHLNMRPCTDEVYVRLLAAQV